MFSRGGSCLARAKLVLKPESVGNRKGYDMRSKILIGILFLGLLAPIARGAAHPPKQEQQDFYQKALEAYLAGDLDQAIVLDSRVLKADPRDLKASSLLNILISEKDQAGRTVIWIGGKPSAEAPAPQVKPVPRVIVQKRTAGLSAADRQKLQELEERVQLVGQLMERQTRERYKEMAEGQAQTAQRLKELGTAQEGAGQRLEVLGRTLKEISKGSRVPTWLALLALLVAAISLLLQLRTRRELARQGHLLRQTYGTSDSEKIVRFNRT